MDVAQELLKLGPAGLVCLILWLALYKSEQREAKKDTRIQLLENQLTESYDERILAADRIAEAIHSTKNALDGLANELRAKR
ncbi:MAG TPA: hypothetical protein VGH70_04595 [Bradyrhizobium sp.]|jgi:hypothetical protein